MKVLKNTLISVLGLNILRPENPDGTPKTTEQMTESDLESYTPLALWVGRESMLKNVKEQYDKEQIFSEQPGSDKKYEDMVAAIDAADGDIEPIIGVDGFDVPEDAAKAHNNKIAGVINKEDISVDEDI